MPVRVHCSIPSIIDREFLLQRQAVPKIIKSSNATKVVKSFIELRPINASNLGSRFYPLFQCVSTGEKGCLGVTLNPNILTYCQNLDFRERVLMLMGNAKPNKPSSMYKSILKPWLTGELIDKGYLQVSVKHLHQLLTPPMTARNNFSELKRSILLPSIQDIEKELDVQIDLVEEKQEKRVTSLRLVLIKKSLDMFESDV